MGRLTGYKVNEIDFEDFSEGASSFYEQHGFVVIRNAFGSEALDTSIAELDSLRAVFAQDMGLSLTEYDQRICQWRDLWMHSPRFDSLLRTESMIDSVQNFMGEDSIQLLHDHVIRKPFSALNETVPWHQDFPFWPVDTPNSLSCWVPMEDVNEHGGCLEVIAGSHFWGASPPVDFIMDPRDFSSRDDIVRIPVNRGSMVVLNSLTWHRSNPNENTGTNRPAYIALWVPSHARYRPDLAGWHPVNEHVSVQLGEHLNEDKFPIFGDRVRTLQASSAVTELHAGPGVENKYMSMFEAAPKIANQISRIAGLDDSASSSLPVLIRDDKIRKAVFEASVKASILNPNQLQWFEELLESMLVNSEAFQKHRARNIYNDAYAQWWFSIGTKWADLWSESEGTI